MSTIQTQPNKESATGLKLNADDVFSLLSSERRRAVMRLLSERGAMTKGNLANAIAEQSGDRRQAVYISLHQVHIPTLEEHGVVSYQNDIVSLTPASRPLIWYLQNGPLNDSD